jgi:hypothetical protein
MVTELDKKREEVAQKIGEESVSLMQPKWLQMMEEGVIVEVHISRWRGRAQLDLSDLGLTKSTEDELYSHLMRLGDKKLLPMREDNGKKLSYVDFLDNIDSNARKWLEKMSFATHWGRFIPFTMYPEWKKGNEEFKEKYFALRDEIFDNYDDIKQHLQDEYGNMARVAYRRAVTLNEYSGTEVEFIQKFVSAVISMLPGPERIYDSFGYEFEVRYIPLPSEIEQDLAKAEKIREELKMTKAEDAAKLRAIMEMNADVVKQAAEQKTKLIDTFLTDLSKQLRSQIYDVVTDVLASLENNDGRLIGKSSGQLGNLIKSVSALNFYGDSDIEGMLDKIRASLGTSNKDRNTDEIKATLKDIGVLTRSSLLTMGDNPRSARELGIDNTPTEEMVRKSRSTIGLGESDQLPLFERKGRD